MKATLEQISDVRTRTGLSIREIVNAFGQVNKPEEVYQALQARGVEVAQGRQARSVRVGKVYSYIHHTGQIGAMATFLCETDFVANSEVFQEFMKNICMQIAATGFPESKDVFLAQPFIKDQSITVGTLLSQVIATTGEKIEIGKAVRLHIR